MAYRAVGANEVDEVAAGAQVDKLDLVLKNQASEAKNRKRAFVLASIAAIIAAARLGLVAVPLIHAAKARPKRGK